MTPVDTAPAKPRGLPTAMASSPGRTASELPGEAGGSPLAITRKIARSRHGSRTSTRPGKRRPSHSSTSAVSARATCALVTISPFVLQMTPDPCPRPAGMTCTVERRSASAISPNPRMSVPPRPLADGHGQLAPLARAPDLRLDRLAAAAGFERLLNIVGVLDRLSSERHQHVPDQYAAFRRRPFRLERKDDQAFVMSRQLHRLQAHAEISAPHPPTGEQFLDHAFDRAGWNRHAGDAGKRRARDADRLARRVHHQAAGGARIHRQIEPDVAVQAPAAPRAPLGAEGADDPQGRSDALILRWPDGQRQMSGRRLRVQLRWRLPLIFGLQDGEIRARIAPRERRRGARSVRQRDRDLLFAPDGVLRRDDHARPPEDPARGKPRPRMHGHDRRSGALHNARQFIGKVQKLISHASSIALGGVRENRSFGWEGPGNSARPVAVPFDDWPAWMTADHEGYTCGE